MLLLTFITKNVPQPVIIHSANVRLQLIYKCVLKIGIKYEIILGYNVNNLIKKHKVETSIKNLNL